MSVSFNTIFPYFFLRAQAVALLAVGQRTRALSRFDRMLQRRPMDCYALASRAHVLVQLGRRDEAITSLQQLTRLNSSKSRQAAAWFNLAYVLQQAGRHEEALPAFERALEQAPWMDRAWYGLALVMIHQQRFDEAVQALEKNIELQPMSPYGWYWLAQVWLALEAPEKARKVIEYLRQFEPSVAAQLERDFGTRQEPLHACKPAAHAGQARRDNRIGDAIH